jgi:hypothetical protein
MVILNDHGEVMALRKRNYLNNRDLLKEIHKSKNSYCSFVTEDSHIYDIILPSLEKINRNTISQARKNLADRLTKENYENAVKNGQVEKQEEFLVNYKNIKKTDLVFRIVTYDHIPEAPGRKKNPKNVQDHYVKLNFPPFQHYKIDENDIPYCVGKSHWLGGMENGYFSTDHGQMTNTLAKMFMVMCERYGSKWNWRGYTYNDEMKSQALLQLAQVGLQFDESKSQNPFAYYTATITNSFTRILNTEKKNQNIRDDMLEMNGYNSSFGRQMDAHMQWKEDTGS